MNDVVTVGYKTLKLSELFYVDTLHDKFAIIRDRIMYEDTMKNSEHTLELIKLWKEYNDNKNHENQL